LDVSAIFSFKPFAAWALSVNCFLG
jgi:hypothetical protein